MKKLSIRLAILVVAIGGLLAAEGAAVAQDLHSSRRPSPMGMARTFIGDGYVFVVYSRPYVRGRDNIFGTEESQALVPFGKIWRTGANEATQLTTGIDLEIGGKTLPAGTYSIFTTPGPETWTVQFNEQLGLSGTGFFDPVERKFEPADLSTPRLEVEAAVGALAEDDEVDQLTFEFEETDGVTSLVLRWATTEVKIPMKAAM